MLSKEQLDRQEFDIPVIQRSIDSPTTQRPDWVKTGADFVKWMCIRKEELDRQDFEAWFVPTYHPRHMNRNNSGDYLFIDAEIAWTAWKARSAELLSLREQLAELKASIGFNVGDRVCDSVDKLGYGYVVSINNGRVAYPISVQFDKSDKGRISTYTADGRKLSGCPVCLYKTQSVTAAKPAED